MALGLAAAKKFGLGVSLSRPVVDDVPALTQLLTPCSDCFSVSRLINAAKLAATTPTWPGTSFPIALPFYMPTDFTIFQLGWLNGGGTMTDSADLGIYESTLTTRQLSTGSVARSGISLWQFTDVADTPLPAGRYYAVLGNNGITANQQSSWAIAVQALTLTGVFDKASADFALPSTLSSMVAAATFAFVPYIAIALRALV